MNWEAISAIGQIVGAFALVISLIHVAGEVRRNTRATHLMQSDAITPVQSVPQSLAAILAERRERTKLGLSKYTAEAAEHAANHPDKLGIAGKVKDVTDVHKTIWPNETEQKNILQIGFVINGK